MLDRSGIGVARAFAEIGIGQTGGAEENDPRDDVPPVASFSEFGDHAPDTATNVPDDRASPTAELNEWDAGDHRRPAAAAGMAARQPVLPPLSVRPARARCHRQDRAADAAVPRAGDRPAAHRPARVQALPRAAAQPGGRRQRAPASARRGPHSPRHRAVRTPGLAFLRHAEGHQAGRHQGRARKVAARWRRCCARPSSAGRSTCSGWILS